MQPLLSVIVPVYKVEDCLTRCIESLCIQSMRDIEIILVDDASPDRCGEICEEYAANDTRFRVIHHSENLGLSAARNTGIACANSDYLMFVDSDDYVHEDFCKLPYECALQQNADLVLFRYCKVKHSEPFEVLSENSKNLSISGHKTNKEAVDLLLQQDVWQMAWNKLYHKNLFQGISYPLEFYFEDWGTTYKTVIKANSIFYLDKVLYYYCYRPGSITTLHTSHAIKDKLVMIQQQCQGLTAWGYLPEELNILLQNYAMYYCICMKRDLSDPNYVFCANELLSCKTMTEGFTWRKKLMLKLFQNCPAIFEAFCIFLGKKCEE